ncbi:MAG: hypothetical protein J6A56_04840, partial [Clostridia bacterium]|nr:hypothetical protein [Clostridia bacterium]
IPEGATTLYFDDDFAADKGYDNVSMTSASVANGNLVLAPAGVGADGLYYAYNNEIPVGGYAEFKVKATGWSVQNFVGSDGLLSISAKGNDVKIGDTTAMIGDGGHVWRTWRVVRTAEGYTGYCKADDDAVWYKAFENVAPAATELSARVDFAKYYAGQTAEYDYLKIYGAAPVVDKVAITDGIGNTFVTVNDEGNADVTYTSMRAFVKKDEEPKTFVIAEYNKSNGVLTNLKIEEVEAIADDSDVISVTYLADEDSVVKVFLWDSLTGVSNLMDAITLNFAQ